MTTSTVNARQEAVEFWERETRSLADTPSTAANTAEALRFFEEESERFDKNELAWQQGIKNRASETPSNTFTLGKYCRLLVGAIALGALAAAGAAFLRL